MSTTPDMPRPCPPAGGRRIVLTGGPGSGKTTLLQRLAADHPDTFAVGHESATAVYRELGLRWDRITVEQRRDVQLRIYRTQRQTEARLEQQHPNHAHLLDRGTIDGATYWPEGVEEYWQTLGTSHATELARYTLVIFLGTTAAIGLYDGDRSNPVRHENAHAALESQARLFRAWAPHRELLLVPATPRLDDKYQHVLRILRLRGLLPDAPG